MFNSEGTLSTDWMGACADGKSTYVSTIHMYV